MLEPRVQSAARDRGLADLRMLTVAVAIGAGLVTVVFSFMAAATNSGHGSTAQAATTTSRGDDQFQRQFPAPGAFAPSGGYPHVVTGGSH